VVYSEVETLAVEDRAQKVEQKTPAVRDTSGLNRRVQPSSRSFYRAELDVLRFCAFFLVFSAHASTERARWVPSACRCSSC
jgi:hypothetical protein